MNKRWFHIITIVLFCIALTGCGGCTRVSPGYVGVKSTLAGSGRGMNDVTVGPSWVFYNPATEDILEYPTYVKTAVWTASKDEGHPTNEEITFTIKGSMQMAADISIGYSLQADKVPAFYLKFRTDDLDTFTHGILRNWAREKFDNAGGKYELEQVMGDNAAFIKEVRDALQAELNPYGVKIEQFGFIGAPRPPQAVVESINEKLKAVQLSQQKENELRQSQADAQKAIAKAEGDAKSMLTRAEAEAEANRKVAASITPTLVQYRTVEHWNGALPQVSGSSGTIISLSPGK